MASICGANCAECPSASVCGGCVDTGGCPFGEKCMVAAQIQQGTYPAFKEKLIAAFNNLHVPGMAAVTELYALHGAYVNLEFELPSGQCVKFWNDNSILLCNQLHGAGGERCFGLAANETYLMVCTYGENGSDPELLVFSRWAGGDT